MKTQICEGMSVEILSLPSKKSDHGRVEKMEKYVGCLGYVSQDATGMIKIAVDNSASAYPNDWYFYPHNLRVVDLGTEDII